MAEDRNVAGSPLLASEGVLAVRVSCNGQALPDTAGIIAVHVRHAVGAVASARLTLADGDMPTGAWPLADADTFAPGAAVRIEAGYDGRVQTVFEGIVAQLSARIGRNNDSRLVVECRSTGDGKLVVRPPASSAEPVLKLAWGVDLVEFRADLDAPSHSQPAQASASDPKTGLARIRGRMSFQGSALARPGKVIDVAGVGARYSGRLFITAAEHEIEDGNWLTHTEFGLADERSDERTPVPAPAAGGTRSEHRLEFDEDDKVVTLTTPGGNKVVLSDKDHSVLLHDCNGNTVRLDGAGIVLDSAKDVVIRAGASIEISAAAAASIAAGTDASVKGLNVACEAQAAMVAKGSATAELSATGQTTVKGAMVMIN